MTLDEDEPLRRYDVRLTEPAEIEIDAAVLRLARFSPELADRWYAGLLAVFASLAQLPGRCPLATDAPLESNARQLIYRNGRIVYRILFSIFEAADEEPTFVRIFSVRHGAQKPSDQITFDDE